MTVNHGHVAKDGSATSVRVLIKGAGEQASATAHRLFQCGYRVVMTDLARPVAVRRTVSFCSAILDGEIEIEGVRGVAHRLEQSETLAEFDWTHIPVFVDPTCELRVKWKPNVIIDARIAKANLDNRRDDAELVIGLGPGLEAGRDVDYVVETHRGHDLGRIIAAGAAASNTGRPGDIGGYTHERVLIAPVAGTFESRQAIGNLVQAGDCIGEVVGGSCLAGTPAGTSSGDSNGDSIPASKGLPTGSSDGLACGSPAGMPWGASGAITRGACVGVVGGITGVIRGLLAPGTVVAARQKLGDIDPRGDPAFCFTVSDKGRTISGSVLEIVVRHALARSIPAA